MRKKELAKDVNKTFKRRMKTELINNNMILTVCTSFSLQMGTSINSKQKCRARYEESEVMILTLGSSQTKQHNINLEKRERI